ncbi:MAG: histidine kinase [Bacteroidota bacterium]
MEWIQYSNRHYFLGFHLWFNYKCFHFYTNVYWFYPKYRKQKVYPFYIVLLVIIINFIEGHIDYLYAAYEELEHVKKFQQELAEADIPEKWFSLIYSIGSFLSPLFFNVFALIASFAYIRWEQSIKQKKQLQTLKQEKIKAELQYLKAQINPHFLFNGINSVYHLIDRNSELAKSTLMQFSSLLRYQLYECNEEKIPLGKEVAYVEDYLAMEKIRRGEEVQMKIDIEIGNGSLQIAPLLLTPFLENAFKYLSNYSDTAKNRIVVQLFTKERELHFQMENTYEKEIIQETKIGGIGIQNVRKRLKLLYPDQYELSTTKDDQTFLVSLKINLA